MGRSSHMLWDIKMFCVRYKDADTKLRQCVTLFAMEVQHSY